MNTVEKRKVKHLYVEADEDYIALQYKEKGDVKMKNSKMWFTLGLYREKENEKLWKEVNE